MNRFGGGYGGYGGYGMGGYGVGGMGGPGEVSGALWRNPQRERRKDWMRGIC